MGVHFRGIKNIFWAAFMKKVYRPITKPIQTILYLLIYFLKMKSLFIHLLKYHKIEKNNTFQPDPLLYFYCGHIFLILWLLTIE